MLYGIISDIHGNYEALKKVLSFLEEKRVDRIINCGDVVGYGPQPNTCLNLIRETANLDTVAGNHDRTAVDLKKIKSFNSVASRAIKWTQKQLTTEQLKFLGSRKVRITENNLMFVHGSPRAPLSEYLFDSTIASRNFKKMDTSLCFIGHTHCPACFQRDNHKKIELKLFSQNNKIKINPDYNYIVNVGSVGQPRDRNPRSCVCIYNTDSKDLSLHRIKYEVQKTQNKILSENLPKFLAERLAWGK